MLLLNWFYSFGHTVFWALIVLGVLIFIHELGHYLVAKKLGIGVSVFSLGFGRRIWGFQRGETDYRLSIVPLGGYVKLLGEDPEASAEDPDESGEPAEPVDPEKSFYLRPVHHRMAVIFAGPLFNILFALILSWFLHMAGVPVPGTWVGEVLPASPAQAAGLQADDHIIGISGTPVNKWIELVSIIRRNAGKRLLLRVDRKGNVIEVPITPTSKSSEGKELGHGRIGIKMSSKVYTERYGPVEGLQQSARRNYRIIRLTVSTLYGMMVRNVPADIAGPIRIAGFVSQQAKRGLSYVVGLSILLSLNLAILNLLPIPILDGGHMLFLTIEALRGKPLSLRFREMSMQVGTVLLIGLMLFVTYKDSLYYILQWTR
ncbi:RIP metalloprotease RseP [Nitrospinota bacterium]